MSQDTSYQSYWESVESAADIARQRAKEGEDLYDVVHEQTDSAWWVIYTHAAHAGLMHSSNEDAAFEEMGEEALVNCDSFCAVVSRLMYFAFRADVTEKLADFDPETESNDS